MLSTNEIIQQCISIKKLIPKFRRDFQPELTERNKQNLRQLRLLKPDRFGPLMYQSPIFTRGDIVEALESDPQPNVDDLRLMIQNPNVDLELADLIINIYILPNYQFSDNVYHDLCANPNLTEQYINDHNSTGWWPASRNLSLNRNISVASLRQLDIAFERSINLSLADLDTIPHSQIDWYEVSINPVISFEMVLTRPDYPWDWQIILDKANTPDDCKQRYPQLPWPIANRRVRPKITSFPTPQEITERHITYIQLSHHPKLTSDFVLQHHNEDWNWYVIAKHKFEHCVEFDIMDVQLVQAYQRLAKQFYWHLVDIMHSAPLGYYYLNDIEEILPADKKQQLQQLRAAKRYDDIKQLLADVEGGREVL